MYTSETTNTTCNAPCNGKDRHTSSWKMPAFSRWCCSRPTSYTIMLYRSMMRIEELQQQSHHDNKSAVKQQYLVRLAPKKESQKEEELISLLVSSQFLLLFIIVACCSQYILILLQCQWVLYRLVVLLSCALAPGRCCGKAALLTGGGCPSFLIIIV